MRKELRVRADDEGRRIDLYISANTQKSRSKVQRLINDGFVLVNDKRIKPGYKVRTGDRINVTIPEEEAVTLKPEPLPVEVLYRDADVIVVDKPPDIVMYPAAGHTSGTVMNAVAYHAEMLASVGGPLRPGVVHRLDRDTSGVVVVALSDAAYYSLIGQFKERSIMRVYLALVLGHFKEGDGLIELPIGRSSSDRKKMSVRTRRGKPARTIWRVIERLKHASLVEVKLATGRTHQIRVHFSALGHPVLGDRAYGRVTSVRVDSSLVKIPRQMLHAESLGFVHPVSGEWLEFHSPIPEDMSGIISLMRSGGGRGMSNEGSGSVSFTNTG